MDKKATKYNYALWRRKQSTAVVKLFPRGKWKFEVISQDKRIDLKNYFAGTQYLYDNALSPFAILWNDTIHQFDMEISFQWGGIMGQSDALKLALSRAIIEFNPELRVQLKPHGMLKRDPRRKERKHPWLKKARKAPQWSKR